MRKIKVFAFTSHQTKDRTSGVDFARIIQPMSYLDGYKDKDVEFDVYVYGIKDLDKKLNWADVAKEYDVIYLNYFNDSWGFAAMGCMGQKYNCKIVLDVDDALWLIRPDNHSYSVYKPGSESIRNFSCMCDAVDYMTCTNNYLRNIISSKTSQNKVKVFTNYIDLELYKARPKFKDDGDIQILHFGSSTHAMDLQDKYFVEGLDMLMKRLPNVTFKTIGAFIPKLKEKWGNRYSYAYGDVDIYKWVSEKFPIFMAEADIVVAPLEIDGYNKSKSEIKYLEYSSAGKPGVYQDVRQYREMITQGENGYLASTANQWYKALKKLATNAELRKKVGENAYNDVQERTIQKHTKDYAEFFKDLTKE